MVSKGWRVVAVMSLLANLTLIGWLVLSPAIDRAVMATGKANTGMTLRNQEHAWNRGDLDGFMADYRMSDETTMYSGGNVRQGWTTIMDSYRKHYQGEGKAMGQLAFTDVQVEPLSSEYCLARGKWAAKMPDGKTPHGLFTLIVKKTPEGWKIVHDHTSVPDPKKE